MYIKCDDLCKRLSLDYSFSSCPYNNTIARNAYLLKWLVKSIFNKVYLMNDQMLSQSIQMWKWFLPTTNFSKEIVRRRVRTPLFLCFFTHITHQLQKQHITSPSIITVHWSALFCNMHAACPINTCKFFCFQVEKIKLGAQNNFCSCFAPMNQFSNSSSNHWTSGKDVKRNVDLFACLKVEAETHW